MFHHVDRHTDLPPAVKVPVSTSAPTFPAVVPRRIAAVAVTIRKRRGYGHSAHGQRRSPLVPLSLRIAVFISCQIPPLVPLSL